MIKLTKSKAKELIKRELGVQISRLLELHPTMPHNPQHPWYHAEIGDLTVVVYTLEGGRVTQVLLQYGCGSISTHFFTDTLEAFYVYSDMDESQSMDDRAGETSERTRRCEYEVREALRIHYSKPAKSVRRCHVCGCTDDRACPDGCYWVEKDLCSRCVNQQESSHAD